MTDNMITELTELTAVNKADLAVIVDDVAGSPVTKKATVNNALATPVDYRDFDESASAPSNPAAGDLRIFALTDNKLYSVDSSGTVTAIGEGALPHNVYGRITPATGDPLNIDGTAAATSLYFSPYKGNMARMWDGTRWKYLSFAELSIKLTESAQTGDTVNGSKKITNLTDTSHFVVGMTVTGTGIAGSSTIASIDSATQITMNNNATADGNDVADLVFKYPASTNYIFSIQEVAGAITIARPESYTTKANLLTKLTLQDGVSVLVSSATKLYLGTFTTSATAGQITDTDASRNIRNEYNPLNRYALAAASGITLLGGYMSTAQKQAATISLTSGGGTIFGAAGNLMDGSTSSTVYLSVQNLNLYARIDFGSDVVIEQIDIWNDPAAVDCFDSVWIYGSNTGNFAGEETLIHTSSNGASFPGTWWPQAFTAPAQYRYWRLRFYGTDTVARGEIHELNFKYGTTLAVMGVPWGCEVELWNGATSVEAVSSASLTKPGLVEFTAAVSSVDKLTITRPDGSTAWLEFAITPTTGIVYALFKDE